MNKNNKPVWKYIMLGFGTAADIALAFMLQQDKVRGYLPDLILLIFMFCLVVWIVLNICGIVWVIQGRARIMLGVYAAKIMAALAGISSAALIMGYKLEAGILIVAGIAAAVITMILCRPSSDDEEPEAVKPETVSSEKKKSSKRSEPAMFEIDRVKDIVTDEYCLVNDIKKEELGETDEKKIRSHACGPVSYFFAWAVKHGFGSKEIMSRYGITDIISERTDPSVYIAENMNCCVRRNDFSERIREFTDSYYYYTECSAPGDMRRSYENDYYTVIRNPWKVFYCIDFSWDLYHKLEHLIDESYRYFNCSEEWKSADISSVNRITGTLHSETFDQDLEVHTAYGTDHAYVEKCLNHAEHLPDDITEALYDVLIKECRAFAEKENGKAGYFADRHSVFARLDNGKILIPLPHGDEPAYILSFEADFTGKRGIKITVRGDVITDISYTQMTDSPWSVKNDHMYRTRQILKLIDLEQICAIGNALREYSSGTLEQAVVIPDIPGYTKLPEENRLFVPAPAAELKSRYDMIAERMIYSGKADGYQCHPVYHDDCMVPSSVNIRLTKRGMNVFSAVIPVWE